MTFYLKPPRGFLNLHQLEKCVNERLICYDNIDNTQDDSEISHTVDYEYLVEDSALDRTGHFLLRLSAYCHTSFQHHFLQKEKKLLETRLNFYDLKDTKQFLKRLMKHCIDNMKECQSESLNQLYVELIDVSSSMLRKGYLRHIFSNGHNEVCEENVFKVPFQHCFSLISNREVNLKGGFVEINCGIWKQILLSLFYTYLKTTLKEMRYSEHVDRALTDCRIKPVLRKFTDLNGRVCQNKIGKFDISKISDEAKIFPLCMQNLYRILEKTSRLPHNERFEFSLYLKDIGLSMTDSLKFWETAYSKQHSSCSKCTHSWQQNEKRYIYGIRHLYGCEGSRKNYKSRSCRYLQDKTLGPTENGGCPFKHFDDNNLRSVLKRLLPDYLDDVEVIMYERSEDPSVACKIFYDLAFKKMTGNNIENDVVFESPAQYYTGLKNKIEKVVCS